MDAGTLWEALQGLFLLVGSAIKAIVVGVAVIIAGDWVRKRTNRDDDEDDNLPD
jgi:hypothetical protein